MPIENLIANVIRADIRANSAYVVPDASGYIKLDAMENPYALPEALRQELATRLADAVLNRYPVASYATLKDKVSAKLGIPDGYGVLLGNGSDELIQIVTTTVSSTDKRSVVMAPVPAFVMYSRSAQFAGADFVGVPLKADFTLDLPAMLAAIAVVPLPMKGSSTTPPGGQEALIMRSMISSGFCVGWSARSGCSRCRRDTLHRSFGL